MKHFITFIIAASFFLLQKPAYGQMITGKVIGEGILILKIMPFQLAIEDIYRKVDF